jgi:hypothetical protein
MVFILSLIVGIIAGLRPSAALVGVIGVCVVSSLYSTGSVVGGWIVSDIPYALAGYLLGTLIKRWRWKRAVAGAAERHEQRKALFLKDIEEH